MSALRSISRMRLSTSRLSALRVSIAGTARSVSLSLYCGSPIRSSSGAAQGPRPTLPRKSWFRLLVRPFEHDTPRIDDNSPYLAAGCASFGIPIA